MSDPVDPPSDIEQVMAGRCIHGHAVQRDCLTCQMTRYLGVSLRRMTSALIAARATVATAGDVLMPFYDCQTGEDRPRWLSEALATSESRYAMPAVDVGEQAPREGT